MGMLPTDSRLHIHNQSADLPAPAQAMPSLSTMLDQLRANRFILLNDRGEALDGFYIEIKTLPVGRGLGHAIYVDSYLDDSDPTIDEINFTFRDGKIVAWHADTSNRRHFVGLEVKYNTDHVAYFAMQVPERFPPLDFEQFAVRSISLRGMTLEEAVF